MTIMSATQKPEARSQVWSICETYWHYLKIKTIQGCKCSIVIESPWVLSSGLQNDDNNNNNIKILSVKLILKTIQIKYIP